MKFLLLFVALTTWVNAAILPTDNNMVLFEFEKVAQTPEDLARQSKIIEMIMPELAKAFPSLMRKSPVQQRQVEYYFMEPTTKLMPPPPPPPMMPKKSMEQLKSQIVMESLPTVLQMIAEEHSTPQQDMAIHIPPQNMKHIPPPPKPFLEPPHFYMKHQHEEPAPQHHMPQPMPPMNQQMIMRHPLMYNMPQIQPQFNPYQYQFIDQQFMAPPPMIQYYPIYEFHPPMTHQPHFYHNQMHRMPMMGQELYYW